MNSPESRPNESTAYPNPAESAEEIGPSITEPADHKQFPDDRITEILQRTWGAWGRASRSEIDCILAEMREEW